MADLITCENGHYYDPDIFPDGCPFCESVPFAGNVGLSSPNKEKCKTLRQIRREIAKQNDIDLDMEECHFQGECQGTCPKCEEEVSILEKALEEREKANLPVKLKDIAAEVVKKGDVSVPEIYCDPLSAFDRGDSIMMGTIPPLEFRTAGIPMPSDFIAAEPEVNILFNVIFREYKSWKRAVVQVSTYRPAIIGRSYNCDVTVHNPVFSYEQIRLSMTGDTVYIENLDQNNPATMNGVLLTGRVPFEGGETTIKVADEELKIEERNCF